ncbi:MAG: DUF2141 domain-containing protein [Acidobacteriota bacterium]
MSVIAKSYADDAQEASPQEAASPAEEAQPAASLDSAGAESAAEIRFVVNGLRKAKGTLRCALYVGENWLSRTAAGSNVAVESDREQCVFRDVAPGTYGISAYHDANDNGELDSNVMRIPKEGIAASNDARARFGPPKFEEARFEYEGGVLELEAEIFY